VDALVHVVALYISSDASLSKRLECAPSRRGGRGEHSTTTIRSMPARAASPSLLPQTFKHARLSPTLNQQSMSSSSSSSLPRLLVSLDAAHPKAQAPTRGSAQAAGYDLYASEESTIPKSGRALVPTGIRLAIPLGCYGRVAPRSGLGKRFLRPLRGTHSTGKPA
jgi:hypothetical protein